jgi:hypothetical protein
MQGGAMGAADADPVFRSDFKKIEIPGRCLAQFSEQGPAQAEACRGLG